MGIEPGHTAPEFLLENANPSVGGKRLSLSDLIDKNGAIIVFTCNHCPYVVASETRIESIAARARDSNLGFVGINSNDPVKYESDSWQKEQNEECHILIYMTKLKRLQNYMGPKEHQNFIY